MFLSRWFKILVVFSITVVLIGLLTFNVVDYHGYMPWNVWGKVRLKAADDHSSVADGIPLRIMFIGASISRGEGSTADRGYRKYMREKLTSWGNAVNCVGFNRLGDWEDNDVEGWGAHRIRTMTRHARQSVPALRPNLILMQLGTSDCFQKDETHAIGERMRLMVETMLKAEPRAAVVLSTLTTTPRQEHEPCILDANEQIRTAAEELRLQNRPVALAEMHYQYNQSSGLMRRPKLEDIGPDGIHPTDEGYIMMGDIFLQSIRELEWRGFLHPPTENGLADNGDEGRDFEDRLQKKTEKEHPFHKRSMRMGERAPMAMAMTIEDA